MQQQSNLTRSQQGRTLTPLDWDALAPLSPQELASVARVQAASSEQPIPAALMKQVVQQQGNSRPATPSQTFLKGSRLDLIPLGSPGGSTRPSSANSSRLERFGNDPLEITAPIETTQQFHDWFARVENSMEKEQGEIYRTHIDELEEYIDSCDDVLEQLDDARGLLNEMEANYRYVEENSKALQTACETMLDEQKHLNELTEAIAARLEYFRELETATRMLNLPGEALVLEDEFLNMLDRLDVCLEYLKANRDFKDAEIYIIRFQQCLTRSMTLIKMYFVSTIRTLASEVAEKMAGKDLSETATNTLLYTKFTNTSESLRVLIFELEKRGRLEPDEYGSLLQECYATWFGARVGLLASGLAEEVRRMDPVSTDLIKLARAGCNHLRAVSMSEWTLFKELFSTGETEIYQFLESLCDYLYDSLRPRILHEPKLEVLCELCTVLNAMMALDTESGADEDESGDEDDFPRVNDVLSPSNSRFDVAPFTSKSPLGRLRFSILLQTILQDSQTRLVFRAQAVIQSEILHYVPASEDLSYPEKLEAQKESGLTLWTEDENMRESEIGGFRLPREEVQITWYPTLKRTVWVLSKLNTYVNTAIFEDFAGEAVAQCRRSLSNAAAQISIRPNASKTDGQLFLIRHLLLLKEMVRSVDMVQIERAADFSTVTDALINLLRNTSVIFNPNALFELASKGIPNFAETMTDAKTDLDLALKRACEELISNSSAQITLPLQSFLDQCTAFLSSPSGKDLPTQTWATAEVVLKLHADFQESLSGATRGVVGKLRVYLNDEKTIGVLLPPLLDEILETYTTFYNLTRSEYSFTTSSTLVAPPVISLTMEGVVRET